MKLKQTVSLSAAVLTASLAMGMPAAAVAQQTGQQAESSVRTIAVGHNVVDAVDDTRETTADFIGALLEAEEGLGLGNWKQQEQRLKQIEQELEQMEVVLDEKAEATDQVWFDWLGGPDYSVTVTQQVASIGSHLEQVSNILAENWQTEGIQVLIGNNVLEQLRDLGETTEDLLNAMENAGDDYGWSTDQKRFQDARNKLSKMSDDLDKPMDMSDADWRNYLDSDEYHVVIHDNVATLAEVLKNLATRKQG